MIKSLSIGLTFLIVVAAGPFLTPTHAASVSFEIAANSGGTGVNQGNFVPDIIDVEGGDTVTIIFEVPESDPYCCGIQVKGNGGEFDTGIINRGETKSVTFTAVSSLTFTSYWPGSITPKATGTVNVKVLAPEPPAAPTGLITETISQTQIDLTWKASHGATAYEVFRNGNKIATTSMLFYGDSGLKAGTVYKYKLRAIDKYLKSEFSAIKAATTSTVPKPTSDPTTPSTILPSIIEDNGSNEISAKDIFVDSRYSYVSTNEGIYAFNEIPAINPGDTLGIWGRTIAFATVTVVVSSDTLSYSTTADKDGFWWIEIDTIDLSPGDHSFQTTVSPKGDSEGIALNAVAFVMAGSVTTTDMATESSETPAYQSLIQRLQPASLVFVGIGMLLIFISAVFWFVKVRH